MYTKEHVTNNLKKMLTILMKLDKVTWRKMS
jgi:hypothetical protein